MSAVNTSLNDREHEALPRAQRAHEPSMEEILASIRTIIAEEREPSKLSEPKAAPTKAAAPPAPPQIVFSKREPGPPSESVGLTQQTGSAGEPGAPRSSGVRTRESPSRPRLRLPARCLCCPKRTPRSLRPLTRWLPISRRAAPNSPRDWRARCCGRCSRPGLTRTCPRLSSGWFGRNKTGSSGVPLTLWPDFYNPDLATIILRKIESG